jgi:hypothetical protein
MDIRLDAWLGDSLEDSLESQLLLGNNWLQEEHKKKKSAAKSEPDRAREGIYHNNGSGLDIISCIHPEHNSVLQVVQACHSDY